MDSTLSTFTGNSSIDFATTSTLGGLVLHSKGLAITRASLLVATATWEAKTIAYNSNYEYVLLTYASTIPKGTLRLQLSWTGTVSNGTEGLYRSQYVDDSGNTKYMLATQFEPNYARRVFPCFDEPAYRAFYSLSINTPNSLPNGLSNSPYVDNSPVTSGSTITHEFKQSATPIPPYLVAFALGEFTCIESTWGTAVSPARACFVSADATAKSDLAGFALTATTRFMEWFETTLKKGYAWPKLDILAIPDFAAGAMENPGLITFRETAMFVDDLTPSFSSALRVVEVVAHEVAHQWFGNHLAPATWNDLWVAEGSATYWSYLAVEAKYPEYGITNLFFLNNEWIPAMQADELSTTSSVKANVTSPAGARSIFDVTTYSKGAAVLRQIANRMGGSSQMTSIMSTWFYANAATSLTSEQYLALFTTNNAGSEATPLITRPSAPIINIAVPTNATALAVTLESYTAFYSGQTTEDTTANWTVLLNGVYPTASSTAAIPALSLSPTTRSLNAPAVFTTAAWYKYNANGMGYYRTQYPTANWNALSALIKSNDSRLSPQDKTLFLSDAFTFAEIGQLDYSIPLDMAVNALNPSYMSYPVWKAAIDELSAINDILQDQSCAGNFHTMLGAILTPAYEHLTWSTTSVNVNVSSWTESVATVNKRDAEEFEATLDVDATANANANYTSVTPNANDVLLRNLILSFGNDFITAASFKANATAAVNDYLADPTGSPLPVDTAAAMLKTAVSTGTFTLWNRVWSRYLVATNVYEKSRLLSALASTDLPYMANLLLTRMISTDGTIRSQDHASILYAIASNEHTGPSVIWDFFRLNVATIYARFPQTISSWVSPLTSFTQASRASDIAAFFTANPSLGVDPSAVVEIINDNAIWISEYSSAICSYVTAKYPGSK